MLDKSDSVAIKKRAGVVHRSKLGGSSVSYFCVAVRQMFWFIGERIMETMERCVNVPRN